MQYHTVTLGTLLDQLTRQYAGNTRPTLPEGAIDTAAWQPACDIEETGTHFVIWADLPGVSTDQIQISMENNILTLQGERKSESKLEDPHFTRVERLYGSFYRRFSLPNTADAAQVQAVSRNGVLEVRIAKKDLAKPRTITVTSL